MRKVWGSVCCLAAAGVASGCASTAGRSADCQSELAQHEFSLSQVVDSGGLQAALEEQWIEETPLALASLQYDSLGDRSLVRVWAETMPEDAKAALESAVEASSSLTHGANQGVFLFLGNQDGPAVRRVGQFRTCPPRILRQTELASRVQAEAQGLRLARRVQTYVDALVRPDGSVSEVRVAESSGILDADLAAARVMRTATFRPALLEGMRVQVWTRVPITFIPRPGR